MKNSHDNGAESPVAASELPGTEGSYATQVLGIILEEVEQECQRQVSIWGIQRLPDGTGGTAARQIADQVRRRCQQAAAAGQVTWKHILSEEIAEAYAEVDDERLREELIQVAAVCASWVRDLDLRAVDRACAGD